MGGNVQLSQVSVSVRTDKKLLHITKRERETKMSSTVLNSDDS